MARAAVNKQAAGDKVRTEKGKKPRVNKENV